MASRTARDANTLAKLFPAHIEQPPSTLSPTGAPGVSSDAAATLAKCLREDLVNFHVFFNQERFHNHLAHHLFAAYKLGARSTLIQAAYDEHASYQRPAFPSPGPIDEANWKEHLGDDKYYAAYLDFFADLVLRDGMSTTLRKYVFSSEANWGTSADEKTAPRMLDRFFAGLVHSFIHYGHGAEFGVPGMAAEGLSWTAAHRPDSRVLFPPEFFETQSDDSLLATAVQTLGLAPQRQANRGIHSFTLLAHILKDDALAPGVAVKAESTQKFADTLRNRGDAIYAYTKQWTADITSDADLAAKVEELSWLATLIYGVGGWSATKGFSADFFLMHLVTSSLFMPSVLAQLDRKSQSTLLRAYASATIAWWISRGRPSFDIRGFYDKVSPKPLPPVEKPTPNDACLDQPNLTQNSWFALLQSVASHPNEHLLKLERALAHYAVVYGDRSAGYWKDNELEGSELLDGTLFIRVAGLSLARLGAVREGEPLGNWDRDGFFDQGSPLYKL